MRRIALIAGIAWALGRTELPAQCPDGGCFGQPWSEPRLAPPPPAARPTPLAEYHRAVLRVGRDDASHPGQAFSGSGTLIARNAAHGLVLTAAHVVEQGGGRLWVDFGSGQRRAAELLGSDARADLAALLVASPPTPAVIPLAATDEVPLAGDEVEVAGFGGGEFRHLRSRVRGYAVKDEAAHDQVVVALRPISGDSGGPVIFRGKLVGVLWGGPTAGPGQTAYETHATCCRRIRQFLDRLGVRLRPRDARPDDTPGSSPRFVEDAPQTVPPPPAAGERPVDTSSTADRLFAQGELGVEVEVAEQSGPGPQGDVAHKAQPVLVPAMAMNRAEHVEPRLFRLWIAACADFRPQRWDEVPHQAVALEPAESHCLTAAEARAFLAGFNARMLAGAGSLWAVALPVSVRYEGDAQPGQPVAGFHFDPATAGAD